MYISNKLQFHEIIIQYAIRFLNIHVPRLLREKTMCSLHSFFF